VAQDVPEADTVAHMAPPIIGCAVVFAALSMIVRQGALPVFQGVRFTRNRVHKFT
jgi:hypothetical protein